MLLIRCCLFFVYNEIMHGKISGYATGRPNIVHVLLKASEEAKHDLLGFRLETLLMLFRYSSGWLQKRRALLILTEDKYLRGRYRNIFCY